MVQVAAAGGARTGSQTSPEHQRGQAQEPAAAPQVLHNAAARRGLMKAANKLHRHVRQIHAGGPHMLRKGCTHRGHQTQ